VGSRQLLNTVGKPHYQGTHHTLNWDARSQTLTLSEMSGGETIMKAGWDEQKGWTDQGSSLSQEKVDYFVQQVKPDVEEAQFEQARQRERQRGRQRGRALELKRRCYRL